MSAPSPFSSSASHRQGKALFRRGRGGAERARRSSTSRSTTGARLRYRFDTALSKGPSVVIGWLGLLTLAIILFTTVVLTIFRLTGVNGDDKKLGPFEAFWQSMLRVVDSGSFAGDTGWFTRLVGLAITLAGIFIAGSLIGLIANSVDQRISELHKGRSRVLEDEHTLILGWSSRVPSIVSELVISNASRKKAAIVILSSVDKTEMENTLRSTGSKTGNTRVICRSGEPWLLPNLDLVNLPGARSIVVVGNGNDAETVKVLLAVRAAQSSTDAETPAPIIAELVSAATARSVEALLGEQLVTVNSDEVVAELTAQACRQRGLSTVFRELLDFDGDELYFAPFPELVGRTYAECQLAFERCAVVGVVDANALVRLNPPANSLFAANNQLIAIVEDDSLFNTAPLSVTPRVLAIDPPAASFGRRRIVVSGWSNLGPRVVAELDEFLGSETTIEVLVDPDRVDPDVVRASLTANNVTLEISELSGGPEVVAAHAARISFHEVIVLGYRDVATDDADAQTLLTLLAFRQVRQHDDVGPVRMVAELLDQRNAPLAAASGADDFIVSDELTSLMLAQLSENHQLKQVFDDLFDHDGSMIELRDANQYGAHLATTFADVVATASSIGQSALGYRRTASGEVIINPAKSEALSLAPDDQILVVAASRT